MGNLPRTKRLGGRALRPLAVAAAGLFALPSPGAYVRGELLWECRFTPAEAEADKLDMRRFDEDGTGCAYLPDGGPNGGGAMVFRTSGIKRSAMVAVPAGITMPPIVLVEADVMGVDLAQGERPHNTSKVVFNCKLAPEGRHRHVSLEPGIRIYRAEEVADEDVVPPFNEAAARIPRGPFADGRHNPRALRGVMSGGDMGEESVRNLAEWGANLVRLQISVPKGRTLPSGEYLATLERRLDEYAAVVDRCHRNGIRVVIDLHTPPPDGAKATKNASNLLAKGYNTTALRRAWRLLATRFRDHPAVVAYDIMNEPRCEPDEWRRIFRETVEDLRTVDPKTPVVTEFVDTWWPEEMNVVYSPHFYAPLTLTHCGVGEYSNVRWRYPGYIGGVYWDKEQMRVALKPWIDFQREHPGARILVGEFSCILWSKGAENYIRDAIDLFEEYGWSWAYHAYREWPAWDVEYTHVGDYEIQKWRKATEDTDRKTALLKGLSFNPERGE